MRDEFFNRFQSGRCRGHFDQQVFALHGGFEAQTGGYGAGGVVRERGGDFEADIAVTPLRALVLGAHQIAGCLDVGYDQRFVERLGGGF